MPAIAHPRDHRHGHRDRHGNQHQRREVVVNLRHAHAGRARREDRGRPDDHHAEDHRDQHLDVVASEVTVGRAHRRPRRRRPRPPRHQHQHPARARARRRHRSPRRGRWVHAEETKRETSLQLLVWTRYYRGVSTGCCDDTPRGYTTQVVTPRAFRYACLRYAQGAGHTHPVTAHTTCDARTARPIHARRAAPGSRLVPSLPPSSRLRRNRRGDRWFRRSRRRPAPEREFQTLHFDFGLPLVPVVPDDVAVSPLCM